MIEKKWHCLYTKAGFEKKVSDQLKRKGIESYYPLTHQKHQSSDRRKGPSIPLFKTYVFVRMTDNDKKVVLRTYGVLSLVHWMGSPVVVRDNEIQLMRMFIAEHTRVQVETTKVNANEMVRIVTDHSSEFTSKASFGFTNPVKIIIPTLGCAIIADSPATHSEHTGTTKKIIMNAERQMATP
ncbi:MAG: transcription termination/antitermination NusG family protein [Chitinophagaceae bacterium]